MRTFLAMLVGAAVIATAVVSVRLHLHVAHLRYRLWALDQDHARAEREHRSARAELEATKAPRRLLERWTELRAETTSPDPLPSAALPPVPAAPPEPGPDATTTVDGEVVPPPTADEAVPPEAGR